MTLQDLKKYAIQEGFELEEEEDTISLYRVEKSLVNRWTYNVTFHELEQGVRRTIVEILTERRKV